MREWSELLLRQVFAQFFLVALAAEFRFAADAALNFPAQPKGFFYARFLWQITQAFEDCRLGLGWIRLPGRIARQCSPPK